MPMIPDGSMMPQQQPNPVQLLRSAIQNLEQALQLEPDDADSQKLASNIQGLYAILAARQKEQDDMLGGKLTPAAARRA